MLEQPTSSDANIVQIKRKLEIITPRRDDQLRRREISETLLITFLRPGNWDYRIAYA
jgi:Trk K+ transport system NAD-binding subunit